MCPSLPKESFIESSEVIEGLLSEEPYPFLKYVFVKAEDNHKNISNYN